MILATGFDAGLGAMIVGLALWAIAARETFAALVAFVAFGLALALAWVRLAAPDVALTEAAIGSAVTGVILIAAARGRSAEDLPAGDTPRLRLRLAAGVVAIAAATGLAWVVLSLPNPAPTLAPAAEAYLALILVGGLLAGGYIFRVLVHALADTREPVLPLARISPTRQGIVLAVALVAIGLGFAPLRPWALLLIGRPDVALLGLK